MNKALALSLVALVGCNYFRAKETSADGGPTSASADPAVSATNVGGSMLDKALSFISGGPFEGDVTMNSVKDGKTMTIVYEVKGNKMRFNPPLKAGESGYVVMDVAAKRMTTVSDSQKSAMVISLDKGSAADQVAAAQPKSTATKTNKTDTVVGYSCDVYEVTDATGDKTDACVAKGIHFPQMGRGESWLAALGGEDFFPMRVVTTDATGKEKARMEVTKVEKKSLPDSTFDIPADYKTINMDDLMKQFGGAGGPGATMMGRPHR